MTLTCVRCRRDIEPDEKMVMVAVGAVKNWGHPAQVAARMALAPGRWHWRCAPLPVRQYAAPVVADPEWEARD